MKILCFDLETTNLDADYGIILCAVFKEVGKKMVVLRLDESPGYKIAPWSDKWLVGQIKTLVEHADIIVSWNGKRFDIPFLQTRLAYHKLSPVKEQKHMDLLYAARNNYRLHSNRLASVSEFLGTAEQKNRIDGTRWMKALTGNKTAMNYIALHCKKDVVVLEQVYDKLKDLVKNIK